MRCAEVKEEFSALLDDELTAKRRAAVEDHLAACPACSREFDQLQRLETMYRALPKPQTPEGFERVVQAAVDAPRPLKFRRSRLRPRALWPLLAAAAGFMVVAGLVFLCVPRQTRDLRIAQAPEAELAWPFLRMNDSAEKTAIGASAAGVAGADRVLDGSARDDVDSERKAAPEGAVLQRLNAGRSEDPARKGEENKFAGGAPVLSAPAPDRGRNLRYFGQAGVRLKESPAREALAARPEEQTATTTTKHVGERIFDLRDGVWRQRGYTDETTTDVTRGSTAVDRLLEEDKSLKDVLTLGDRVIFKLGTKWYRVQTNSDEVGN